MIGVLFLSACGETSHTDQTQKIAMPGIAVRSAANSVTATLTQQYDVIRLIQSMFNAAPGALYLNAFAGYVVDGMTMDQLAEMLEQTDTFKTPQLYPPSLSNQQFASRFMDNIVGSAVDSISKGLIAAEIVNQLNTGKSRGTVIWMVTAALVSVPVTDVSWGRAVTQFSNKVDVAYDYSVVKGKSSTDLGTLQAVTAAVTDDPATVVTAKNTIPVNLAPSWASVGITGGNRQTTLSWAATAKTTGTVTYNMYWSTNPGVTQKTGNKLANIASPYIHTGLTNNRMYYYVVTAVTAGLEGPESLEVATASKADIPPVPIDIAVAPANGAVQLSLDAVTVTTASKFNLYYSTSQTFSNPIKIPNAFGGGTTFRHAPLVNGTTYYYGVTAEGAFGESPKSKIVAATPLADISAVNYVLNKSQASIATPNAFVAVPGDRLVNLSWNMPSNQIPAIFAPTALPTQAPIISAYNIYWATSPISNLTAANKITIPADSTTKLPLFFTHNAGLSNSITYYYTITAVSDKDANGDPLTTASGDILHFESPAGSQVAVVPEAAVPTPPTAISAVSGPQQIKLSWTSSATKGALYNIYASTVKPSQPEDLVFAANLIAAKTTTIPYIHSGLQNGTTYYYVVTAVTDAESTPTSIVRITLF